MHHFDYVNGSLHCEGVALEAIAEAVGTPVYVYSTATIRRHFQVFAKAVGHPHHRVFFAMKANGNLGVLATLIREGAGIDVVSEGEIRKAMAAGAKPSDIVFSGVGKTQEELAFAVSQGIYQINVETEGELDVLARVAQRLGKTQVIALRVNPDIGAGGHAKITTGSRANKFGVSFDEAERLYAKASRMAGIHPLGVALHIGSQIFELTDLRAAFEKMRGLVERIRASGERIERLDLGGGIGVPYEITYPYQEGSDRVAAYAAMVQEVTQGLDVELGFEPGRLLVGNAGVLLTRALYINERPEKRFLVLDSAMNDLIRPAMYDAHHEIWPVSQSLASAPEEPFDVVGPICESGDQFAADRRLPDVKPGDLLCFMTAGAYGAAMSSTYNQRRLVAEVLVQGNDFAVTRPRETWDALIGKDRMPEWLAPASA
jgi:diaminopimelate decarboxylase